MIPNYQVRFKDIYGEVTHVLAGAGSSVGGLSDIVFENVVNSSGSHSISIRGDVSMSMEIGLDYQVEVWNRPPGSLAWVLVYEGFHRTWTWQTDSNGQEIFTSHGSGYTSLLGRRIIASYSGTSGSSKYGPAETVIKAFVNENVGPSASTERQFPGLAVQVDAGQGNSWYGSRAWNNLLEVCQEIAYAGGGDFKVVGTGPATFEFQWFNGQLGKDRTLGNLYGNDPIIFSMQRNNMMTPVLSLNHSQEFNYVYVLGQGEGTDRMVVGISNVDSIASSPWNRIEIARQATSEDTENGLETEGAEELMNGLASQSASFEVAQTPYSAYGIHYGLGDKVTSLYHKRIDKKITRAQIHVNDERESIRLELADVA